MDGKALNCTQALGMSSATSALGGVKAGDRGRRAEGHQGLGNAFDHPDLI